MYGNNHPLAQQASTGAVLGGRPRTLHEPFPEGAAEQQKRSEFMEYRERAYMSMSSLAEVVSEMERRLNPVLRPVPMPATGNAQSAGVGPALSPVAETLNGVANHASELRERVVALLDALAV